MGPSTADTSSLTAFAAAAVGAFLGSGSAFALEWLRRRSEAADQRYSSLVKAHYALTTQLGVLEFVRSALLDDYREVEDRHLKWPPFTIGGTDLRVDFEPLWFLVAAGEPGLAKRLHETEGCYLMAMTALDDLRTAVEDTHYGPKSELRDIDLDAKRAAVQFDPAELLKLKGVSDEIFGVFDTAIERMTIGIGSLAAAAVKLYPGRPPLRIV